MAKANSASSQRRKQLHQIDLAQHNSRVQVTLANVLQALGFFLEPTHKGTQSPIVIHAGTEQGVDIRVRRQKGENACVHIEVEMRKGGGIDEVLERWLKRPEVVSGDAQALIIVHADPGWWQNTLPKVRKKLGNQPGVDMPVHCVALEDYVHLVPMLACHYLLTPQSTKPATQSTAGQPG